MTNICNCGCGGETKCNQNTHEFNSYLHGHNCRSHPRSAEVKIKIGNSNRGKVRSLETRLKLSIAQKNSPFMRANIQKMVNKNKGKHLSAETKRKLSEINKGRVKTVEERRKLSESLKGKHLSEEHKKHLSENHKGMKGKHHSIEARRKISEGHIGKHPSAETRLKMSENRLQQVFPFKDTLIEIALQNKLKEAGVTFRKHEPITGQPDIFIEPNICIFVDGCWWHACQQCYNQNKFGFMQRKAIVRDQLVTEKLARDGYVVIRFWEHDINKDMDYCMFQINNKVNIKQSEIVKSIEVG